MTTLARHSTVTYRQLLVVVIILALVKSALVIVFPSALAGLAPDELTYADLARTVGVGGDWAAWQSGWGSSLFPRTRSLIVPSALLTALGTDPLLAVRLVSIAYSTAALAVLLGILALAREGRVFGSGERSVPLMSFPILGMCVYAFLPSHFTWSVLGLKESGSELWALMAVLLIGVLFGTSRGAGQRLLLGLGLVFTVWMQYQTRTILGFALFTAIGFAALVLARWQWRSSVILAASAIVGVVLGVAASAPIEPQGIVSTTTSSLGSLIFGGGDVAVSQVVTEVAGERAAATVRADTAIDLEGCLAGESVGHVGVVCEIARFPKAFASVLVAPLWPWSGTDVSGSSARLASMENIVWLLLFCLVVAVALTRRLSMRFLLIPSLTYAFVVLAAMAVGEGNLGTAFRHKSAVLWVPCLILVLVDASRLGAQGSDTGAAEYVPEAVPGLEGDSH